MSNTTPLDTALEALLTADSSIASVVAKAFAPGDDPDRAPSHEHGIEVTFKDGSRWVWGCPNYHVEPTLHSHLLILAGAVEKALTAEAPPAGTRYTMESQARRVRAIIEGGFEPLGTPVAAYLLGAAGLCTIMPKSLSLEVTEGTPFLRIFFEDGSYWDSKEYWGAERRRQSPKADEDAARAEALIASLDPRPAVGTVWQVEFGVTSPVSTRP